MLAFSSFLIIFSSLFILGLSCGTLVHNQVVHRATTLFNQPISPSAHSPSSSITSDFYTSISKWLLDRPSWTQPGSYFPDWGYVCFNQDDNAEFAHWPPFLKNAIDYISQTYQPPYSDHAKDLFAFIYGTLSHMTSDNTWHSIGTPHGFIQAMGAHDFNGSYKGAHDIADIGGDTVTQHAIHDLEWVQGRWDVPIDDIANIYAKSGINLNKNTFRYCMARGFALSMTFKRAGMNLFSRYAKHSPFLVDNIEDYPLGGLNEMVASTVQCWHNLTVWITQGTPENPWTICPSLASNIKQDGKSHQFKSNLKSDGKKEFLKIMENEFLNLENVTIHEENGVVSFISEPHQTMTYMNNEKINVNSEPPIMNLNSLTDKESFQSSSKQTPFNINSQLVNDCPTYPREGLELGISVPYAEFGRAIDYGDFSGDGSWDLVVSAPYDSESNELVHSGSVFIIPSKDILKPTFHSFINVSNIPNVVRLEPEQKSFFKETLKQSTHARFGWNLAVIDFNHDGIDDLAISAPGYNQGQGRVCIYFGRHEIGLDNSIPNVIIDVDSKDKRHRWEHGMSGFGSTLFSADLNGDGYKDLIIGSPNADIIIDKFTQSFHKKILHQAGDVRIFTGSKFKYPLEKTTFITARDANHVLYPPDKISYENFGSAIDFLPDVKDNQLGYLVISSPGYTKDPSNGDSSGRVLTFQIGSKSISIDDIENHHRITWSKHVLDLVGSEKHASFGRSIAVGKLHNDQIMWLGVGSPSEGIGNFFQSGTYRLFDLKKLLNQSKNEKKFKIYVQDEMEALVNKIYGTGQVAKMGKAQARADWKNIHKIDMDKVWIGENMVNDESGRVYRWNLVDAFEMSINQNNSSLKFQKFIISQADYCLDGSEGYAHFGSQILIIDQGGIAISAPRSSQIEQLSGKVILYL